MSAVELPDSPPGATSTPLLRTLVLCDLVDSTALVERLGDQRGAALMRKHDRLARDLVLRHGGREIDKTDGFLVLFERPINGVAFALDYQRELQRLSKEEQQPLRARVGLHVGDVVMWDNAPDDVAHGAKPVELEGLVKPVAARLAGLALPGQILASGIAAGLSQRAHGELGDSARTARWINHGRYRFKGVPEPLPVYEIGEAGIAPLKAPPWSGKAHREVPWWRTPASVAVEVVLMLGLAGSAGWYLLRPPPAIAFGERDWVVIGNLQNHTSQKLLDDSLQTAFRIGLEQSRYVNVMPDLQVRDALKRMQRGQDTPVDRAVGAEIAQREGARAVIVPSVTEIGGHVRVTAEVIDPVSQSTVYSDLAEGQGLDSVLPSTDALLTKLRGRLGESLASIGTTSVPLAKATTANLDALKAYSLGMKSYAEGKHGEAIALFEQATKQDPDFALAYLGLTNLYYSAGQRAKARGYMENATQHLDRLSARERLMAEGYAAFFQTPAALRERWTMFAKLYPDVMSGQQDLALTEWWFDNDLAEAEKNFAEITRSRHPLRGISWMLMGDVQLARENIEGAKASYRRARELGSQQEWMDPLNLWIASRDQQGFDAALKNEPTNGYPAFEVEKLLRVAAMHATHGRLSAARQATEQAAQTAKSAGLEAAQQRAMLAHAALSFAAGDSNAGNELTQFIAQELPRVESRDPDLDTTSISHLSLAGLLAVRHGLPEAADKAGKALAAQELVKGYFNREQMQQTLQCEAAARSSAGDPSCFDALLSERTYYQTRVGHWRSLQARQDSEKTAQAALWLVEHRGRATADWHDYFAAQILNLLEFDEATVALAELQRKKGEQKAAQQTIGRFLDAWRDADAQAPLLVRAKALQATLASPSAVALTP